MAYVSEELSPYPCEDGIHHCAWYWGIRAQQESLLQSEEGEGEQAAGEETLDGYVKKDLFHCQNQKALPKSQL